MILTYTSTDKRKVPTTTSDFGTLFGSRSIARSDLFNLPLGVDCSGIAEPHVARGGIGSNVLERAGFPFEGVELTRCQPARPYDGTHLIDVFGG